MRRMRSPSHTAPMLALSCALVLSACSAWGGEDAPEPPGPSAISPDAVVVCEETGDCGQAGAVRWSRPLEGDFYLERFEESGPLLRPARHWLDYKYPGPGALEADGVLYLHTADTVVALDTATAATLWTESVGVDVALFRLVGSTLVATPVEGQGQVDALRFLEVDRDGARVLGSDLPEDLAHTGVLAADDTHLALRESLPFDSEDDPRYFLVEAATGRVAWSARLSSASSHAVAGETLYLGYSPEEEPSYVRAVVDGERTAEFEAPEQAGLDGELRAVPEGPLLFDTPGCASAEEGRCGEDRVTAVDPVDGEVLWTHTAPGEVVSVSAGRDPLVFVHDEDGYRALDADTGQVLAEDGGIDAAELLSEFGAEHHALEEEEAASLTQQEYDLLPIRPTGPGVDVGPLEGLAAGAEHLTTYPGPDGGAVGVYAGCAPDGLRPPAMDAPTGATTCAGPRLFAVDY
ncbi:hypothetical protein CQJ94_16210 [Glycomyces fuscus]|nr:hypothetical protein CQJ94_16210 [Glycomyces fuscus]